MMKTSNLCLMAGLCLFAFSCKKESTDAKLPFENGVATFTPTGTLNVGLAAYYPFSGNTNDASGNSNHGTAFGSAALSANRFGEASKAYSFAGTGYIRIPNSTTTDITGNFSISLWVEALWMRCVFITKNLQQQRRWSWHILTINCLKKNTELSAVYLHGYNAGH